MVALSDLRDFFQPKTFHDLQLLAKSQVEKAAGRGGRKGPGMSGLGKKERECRAAGWC